MAWKSKQITHDGFPLLLRYPETVDVDAFRVKFPNLIVVTHRFTAVSSNGLPDPDYNDGLIHFDKEIREAFETSCHGVTVLIETFGGKRNYYFYAEPNANVTEILSGLNQVYPQENLSWSIRPDASWSFIEKYSKQFLK